MDKKTLQDSASIQALVSNTEQWYAPVTDVHVSDGYDTIPFSPISSGRKTELPSHFSILICTCFRDNTVPIPRLL